MFSSRLLLLSAMPSGASLASPTVITTSSLSVCAPPLPLPPRSSVAMVSSALPANSESGMKVMPSSATLMAAIVPVKVIAASSPPSPEVKVSPAVPASVSVPWLAVRVTSTGLVPASASPMEIAFAFPVAKTSAVSWVVVCGPGTTLTGALFSPSRLITDTSVASSPL